MTNSETPREEERKKKTTGVCSMYTLKRESAQCTHLKKMEKYPPSVPICGCTQLKQFQQRMKMQLANYAQFPSIADCL